MFLTPAVAEIEMTTGLSDVDKANMTTKPSVAVEANMTKESCLGVDFMQLKDVSRFFHFAYRDFKKEKLCELFFPPSVTLDDCQYFLDTIVQSRPILPKLLSVLHASAVFILADYFCVDLVFEELHVYFTHNLTMSPLFLKLFCIYYSCSHPHTIAFYNAFTESFKIPHSKFLLKDVSCMGMKTLKKTVRDHLRRTVYMENIRYDFCYVCRGKIVYTLKLSEDATYMVYDYKKLTKMPCCATPTHPSCTYNMLYRRNGFYCCTRCKTILQNGQASWVDVSYGRERVRIRKQYGISTRRLLPSLDFSRVFSSEYNEQFTVSKYHQS